MFRKALDWNSNCGKLICSYIVIDTRVCVCVRARVCVYEVTRQSQGKNQAMKSKGLTVELNNH